MLDYFIMSTFGVWFLCDGIISIRLYLKTVDETGKRLQSWKYDHSIRLIRMAMSIVMVIRGGYGICA